MNVHSGIDFGQQLRKNSVASALKNGTAPQPDWPPLVPPLKAHGSRGATSQPGEPSKESPQAAGEIHSRRVGFQAETAEQITCGHEPMMKKKGKSKKTEMNNKCEAYGRHIQLRGLSLGI
jgi:hypothetical protein